MVYYRLDETAGPIANDSSGNGQAGVYSGGALYGTDGAPISDSDSAVTNPGGASFGQPLVTQTGASLPAGTSARTLEVWYRSTNASGQWLMQYGDSSNHVFGLYADGNLHVYGDSNAHLDFVAPHAVYDDAWHLLDVTFDGSLVTLYLDGQVVGEGPLIVTTPVSGSGLGVGSAVGDYDEAAIYATALNPDRVAAHWSRGGSGSSARCVAAPTAAYSKEVLADAPVTYMRLGDLGTDASGRVAFDSSGNCHNGAYATGAAAQSVGALSGDNNGAFTNPGGGLFGQSLVTQSGASLPAGSSPRTLEIWYRSTNATAQWLMQYGDPTNHVFGLYADGNLHIYGDGLTQLVFSAPHSVYDDAWHLLDVTYDGSVATLYLDGQVIGEGPLIVATPVPGNGLGVGAAVGDYDEAAVYAAALSPDRIAAHWTRGGSRSATACVAKPTTPYPTEVLADTPALYLRLGDLAGDATNRVAFDSSGGCHNGAFATGAKAQSVGALIGDGDGAVSNPGGGLYSQSLVTQSGANLPAGSSPRTLEVWYRSTNAAAQWLIRYGDSSNHVFGLYADGNLHIYGDSNAHLDFVAPHAVYDDAWHLLDLTYDANRVATLYLDGQVVGEGPLIVTTPVPGSGLAVGSAVGDYDEAAIYGSALSPDRVAAHWSRGGSSSSARCVAAPTAAYSKEVLADAPVTYMRLGDLGTDASGRVAFDSSGNCHNGAYATGAAAQSVGALSGDSDGAVTNPGGGLFGQSLVTQSGASLPSGSSPRTLEIWYRSTNATAQWLMQYGDPTNHAFGLYADGNLHIYGDSNAHLDFVAPHAVYDDAWHLLDVTYDGSVATLYLDGQVIGAGPLIVATPVPGNGLGVGGAVGDYDEAAVYAAALSPDRIAAHWTRGGSRSAAACVAKPTTPYPTEVLADTPALYLRLGDLAADVTDRVAFDSSGGCHNGAFAAGTKAQGAGALIGDGDGAVSNPGGGLFGQSLVTQSGASLPAGSSARTLEVWYRSTNAAAQWLIRYGDYNNHEFGLYADGNFHIYGDANAHVDFTGAGLYDNSWHLIDVTYDGTLAGLYADGQLIGRANLVATTLVPGNGLSVGAAVGGYDEVAVYPTVLSAARISSHWNATPPGFAIIAGGVTGTGTPMVGASVQACPSVGGACVSGRTSGFGGFRLQVPVGTYAVTAFPIAGSGYDAPKTAGPFTVPPSTSNVAIIFARPGALPPSSSLTTPSQGIQQGVTPFIYWGEPSTYTTTGCAGGFGVLGMSSTNTSTGQAETRFYPLVETPTGSGTYVGQIPPLFPLHGLANATQSISCPVHTSVLPDSGPSSGGTQVLLAGIGFTGATAVHFGTTAASSFSVLQDNLIQAVSPAGTGSVPVTVTSGTTSSIGNFNYFDVTSLDTSAGPSSGGTSVTIHGQGFNNVQNVVFGLLPATSFTVVDPNTIQAVAPLGVGTVDVQVINGYGTSAAVPAAFYSYQGGPPAGANINEGTGPTATANLAAQVFSNCADTSSTGIGSLQTLCRGAGFLFDNLSPEGVLKTVAITTLLGVGIALLTPITLGPALVLASVLVLGWTLFDFWKAFIDPSGEVVDSTGNPINGATVSLLGQSGAGASFALVPASSGNIVPAVNPETTGATGAFHWDAVAGGYEVQASAPNCHAPGVTSQSSVTTNAFTIPPPAVGLVLTLECPGSTPPAPSVSRLSPNLGVTAGGTAVEIEGTGLGGVTAVHFGTASATRITVLSPYAVLAFAPPGTSNVDVTVTGPGGTSPIVTGDVFSYYTPPTFSSAPTVSSVSPSAGPAAGGDVVTITGTNLTGAYGVAFGSIQSLNVTNVSSTTIQAVAPAGEGLGRVDITVTGPGGTSAPGSSDGFIYAPAVASLPAMANRAYGGYTTVTYIENVGTQAASVAILYVDANGIPAGRGDVNLSLAPHALWVVHQDNGNSLASGAAGSGLILSTQPVAAFVNEFAPTAGADATSYTAIQLPSGAGSQLFAPSIANDAYGGYTTGLAIVNLGSSATTLTVTYRDTSGVAAMVHTVTGVGPGAYQGLYSGSAGLPAGFAGTATIASSDNQPLAVIVNETGPGGQFSSYDAVPGGSTRLNVPVALNSAYGGYFTGIGIQNTSATAAPVTVTYYDSSGTPTAKTMQIAALGYLPIYQGDPAVGPAPGAYTATITSAVPLAAIVNEIAPPGSGTARQATSYNAFASGAGLANLALVESSGSDGWSTGLGIMNTGSGTTTVTVTYLDVATGNVVGTPQTISLAPKAFWGLYQPSGGLPNSVRATAEVTASAGGTIAMICNESNTSTFMSYAAQ